MPTSQGALPPDGPLFSDRWIAEKELRLGEWLLRLRLVRWLTAKAGLLAPHPGRG